MALTHTEAKMIAAEVYRLMHKDIKQLFATAIERESERQLTIDEVAQRIGKSRSFIYRNIDDIPHTRTKSGRLVFMNSGIVDYVNQIALHTF